MFKLFIDNLGVMLKDNYFLQSGFVAYGDIMQFSIIFAIIALVCIKDFLGIRYIVISSCLGLGIMQACKIATTYLLRYYDIPYIYTLSKRPDSVAVNGFPSGHTCAVFVVAGFIWKRYGYKLGLLAIFLGILVGLSRVYALRHTYIQVICGAILGFTSGYMITKER